MLLEKLTINYSFLTPRFSGFLHDGREIDLLRKELVFPWLLTFTVHEP